MTRQEDIERLYTGLVEDTIERPIDVYKIIRGIYSGIQEEIYE